MEKYEGRYGTYLISGGILLFLYGIVTFLFTFVIGTSPNWTIFYWKLLGIIIICSGISATLSGLTMRSQDYQNSTMFSLISIIAIIPIYSINESFNDVASNASMPYSYIFSIIVITILSQTYSIHKGIRLMTEKYKLILAILAIILIIIGIMIWPVSFEYLTWGGRHDVIRYPYRYTTICYFILSGYIVYWLFKKPRRRRK